MFSFFTHWYERILQIIRDADRWIPTSKAIQYPDRDREEVQYHHGLQFEKLHLAPSSSGWLRDGHAWLIHRFSAVHASKIADLLHRNDPRGMRALLRLNHHVKRGSPYAQATVDKLRFAFLQRIG